MKVKSLSHVRLLVTPWTAAYQAPPSIFVTPWAVAHQAPLSMEFPRQEYWSGLPFPLPGDLPDQGLNPGLPHCKQILYH